MKLTAANGHAETELHSAAWNGDIEWARELISNGSDVNQSDSIGEIPLHGAAACGNTEMVKLLLEYGSNYTLISSDGLAPIHWAASHGNASTVAALIEGGADPIQMDDQGRTPLEIAKNHNNHEVIAYHRVSQAKHITMSYNGCSLSLALRGSGLQSAWLLGTSRRATTRIKPTSAVKAFGFSVLAAYPPPRYVVKTYGSNL